MKSFDVLVDTADVDSSSTMRISSLFLYMQKAAMLDSDERGIGYLEISKENLIWVITRYHLEITRLPRFEEKVTVSTYPGDTLLCFYPRYFVFTDGNGNVLLRASSVWSILDRSTRKPVGRNEKLRQITGEKHEGELAMPGRIIPKECSLVGQRKVLYSDVDLNGHLNNVRYISMICDLKDSAFFREHSLKDFSVNYLHEIHEGDVVELYSDKDFTYVEAKVDGTLMFAASFVFD